MDLDLAKNLSNLQERKLALEAGTDLSSRCDTIVELDQKVSCLLERTKKLRFEVEQCFKVDDVWKQLEQPYKVLTKSSYVHEFLNRLHILNQVCRRIDANPNLIHSEDGTTISLNLRRVTNMNTDENDAEKTTVLYILDLIEEFELNYNRLESVLSSRTDLPYVNYAIKVKLLRSSIENSNFR